MQNPKQGYTEVIPVHDPELYWEKLRTLEFNDYFDYQTRQINLYMNFYDRNLNMLCLADL